jgi:hypothetical protein
MASSDYMNGEEDMEALQASVQNVIDQTTLKWIFVGGKGGERDFAPQFPFWALAQKGQIHMNNSQDTLALLYIQLSPLPSPPSDIASWADISGTSVRIS